MHMTMEYNVTYLAGDWLATLAWDGIWPMWTGLCEAILYTTLAFILRRVLPVIEESKGVV